MKSIAFSHFQIKLQPFLPCGQRQTETLLRRALNLQAVILYHLFHYVGQGRNIAARQAGNAEFSVMLDHIQMQSVSGGRFAQEPHVRDLTGIGSLMHGADIINVKCVMADGHESGGLPDFLPVVGGFRHALAIHGSQHVIN